MRAQGKSFTTVVTTVLSLGLLCLQVCSIACAFAPCFAQAKVEQPIQSKETGHCHQHESAPEDSRPQPQQPSDSHDCHTHDAVSSLPPTAGSGANGLNHSWQPDWLAPFVFEGFPFDHLIGNLSEHTPFRSPPRQPLRSILRI